MSLKDLFSELAKDQEGRTRRERHGRGELTLRDEIPVSATGCILPDGTLTDAECLLPGMAAPNESHRVWTRRLAGTALRRRGRLKVDCGKALLFIDEPDADLVPASAESAAARPDLERDLGLSPRIRGLARSEVFAMLLYDALCNTATLLGGTRRPALSGAAAGGMPAASSRACAARVITWTG